jgi:addiction module RelE/StbE family toxin
MWEIYEHNSLSKKFPRLPMEVLKKYEKWKDIAGISGPEGLRLIKGFHDEALKGHWQGYRSSRLGLKYRIIYHAVKEKLYVQVIDITPHDYRRR